MSLSRAPRAAVLSVVLVGSVFALGCTAEPQRDEPHQDVPRSTQVPISTPDGEISSYVINVGDAQSAWDLANRAVRRAEGVVVQEWPQIRVVIAHSESGSFRTDLMAEGRWAIDSVGVTRTAAVKEGTPGRDEGRQRVRQGRGGEQSRSPSAAASGLVADPREDEQWGMRVIKAHRAHSVSEGSPDVLVGVLDSGIDPDHPDLAPNLDTGSSVNCTDAGRVDTSATGWHPTTSDHGTHVAGTIAAARNGVGIVGVAPNARMASVKVVNGDGFIYPEYAICGFMWAGLAGMDVTNNSYYVDPFRYWCSDRADQAAIKQAVERAVRWSTAQGVVHAGTAGNVGTDLATNTTDPSSPNDGRPIKRTINSGCHTVPAELPGVVTVSWFARKDTTTLDTHLSRFSNRGLGVIDVGAPGSRILSTIPKGNGWGLKSGTSMASPHVAGVLALLASTHPAWTPEQLSSALEAQAEDKPCEPPQRNRGAACVGNDDENSFAGEGLVDALEAVQP